MLPAIHRRRFLQSTAATSAITMANWFDRSTQPLFADTNQPPGPWLRKTLKLNMINVGETYEEKFAAALEAGFAGVEPLVPLKLIKPGKSGKPAKSDERVNEIKAMIAAAESTGIIIDGTVASHHWKIRHTDPDEAIRKKALDQLELGIRQTSELGAQTILLVPGHGKDGTPAEVTERAISAIQSVMPLLEKHGVRLLIENVWNHFLYDHDGDNQQTANALAKFIDTFDSPLVGVQFDIGNHWKYGDPAAWIRTLGPRIQKLDIKGFSRTKNKFTNITEGDIDWPSVKTALESIQFRGWIAAEVKGGNEERLKQVARNMETSLQCSES